MSDRHGLWDRFWFSSAPLTRLGAFRMLICGLALYDVVLYRHAVFGDAAAVSANQITRSWSPIYLFDVLGVQPIGIDTAEWVFLIALIALAMGMVGLLSRLSCLVGFVLFLYWTGLAYSFGKPHHDKVALAFALIALPFAPVGYRLSIDSLLRRWFHAALPRPTGNFGAESRWAMFPLRLTQVSIALGYFFAGASKLIFGGTEWFNGYTLQAIMLGHNNEWSEWFARNFWMCRISSVGIVATQFLFPLVFFWRRLLWFFIPVATLFHLITWQTMDTGPYMRLWFTMIAFLPLERVPRLLREHFRSTVGDRLFALSLITIPTLLVTYVLAMQIPTWILILVLLPPAYAFLLYLMPQTEVRLIYDGNCRMCRRTCTIIQALDWSHRTHFHDLSNWQDIAERYPHLKRKACLADMHAVQADSRITSGFDTYRTLAWRLPLVVCLAPILYLPPISWLGRAIYRLVADNRTRRGCGSDACSITGS